MRAGIIQSNYIPWRGYFAFIAAVDLFIFHDDVQYTKGDWRNRNKIKTPNGPKWLTVPVKYKFTAQLICQTEIDHTVNWQRDHLNQIRTYYARAPFVHDALSLLEQGVAARSETISDLNVRLARLVFDYLGITTQVVMSSQYAPMGTKTARVLDLLKKVGASIYLSGPSGADYIDLDLFRQSGIGLEYKTYDYSRYPQLWGEFEGAVSILDLIANVGPDAKFLYRSETPDRVVIP